MEPPTEAQLLQFLYACPIGLIEFDAAGDIGIMNPFAMQHLLQLAGERDSTNLFSALEDHAPDIAGMIAAFGQPTGRICDGRRMPVELGGGRRLARKKVLAYTIVKITQSRFMMTLADVTVEVERERRLSEAEATNRAKSQFMANMSHEIRTPLNGVLGMAQALSLDSLAPSQQAKVQTIRDAGRSLLIIVNDILDLSKIEAGQFELEVAPFDFEQMAKSVCAIFGETAKDKGLPVMFSTRMEAMGLWEGDANRCRQIVSNLLANAIKFTSAGEVRVELERSEAGGIRLHVCDTGVGIDAADLPNLFEKFYQADASETRRYGGSGLGLSICQELSQLMGGAITVKSFLGSGSIFTVDLPLKFLGASTSEDASKELDARRGKDGGALTPGMSREKESAHTESANALRVLAAEDNPTNQLVLRSLLEAFDVEVVVVENGRLAVEAWEAGEFDIILMDIQMPELDGVTATRRIRALEVERGRTRIPIVALTANIMTHQVEEYHRAGMDGLVAKPIQIRELSEALYSAINELHDDPVSQT